MSTRAQIERYLSTYPEMLTAEQCAEALGQRVETVQKWLRDGDLPGIRLAHNWRVLRSDLSQWMIERSNVGDTGTGDG